MEYNLAKTYDPKAFEDRIYKAWEESGAFVAHRDPDKKPFTIVMPPPNITGQLHMGHALDQSLQDVLIRFKRMQGYSALWLPGSDHASIATEVKVVDKLMEEEGKTKEDIGREAFLERAWDWKKEYGGRINEQVRKLGNSCDWSRERFTMDEGCNRAVNEHFVRLYEKGLIYKGNRLINWCPTCGSALSDIEVEHVDKNGKYWYFRYPAEDGGEGIVVATSRPETMFGDTAVAVHPEDERFRHLIGKNVILPLVGRKIPVIADLYPDPEKGTGAVKITPAHDPNDFEVGLRHELEQIVCINEEAKMTAAAGAYEGLDRYACRKAWVKALKEGGFMVKEEDLVIPTGECYRCHDVIEPLISDQWFVRMKPLAEPAMEAARSGALKHVPDRFEKIYMHWLEEIKDWCISRQLWWGHRIPAYYCDDCGEVMVSATAPAVCASCGSGKIRQDEDVLDTWFSSALWPFSTLGWPENTEDLRYFYPTNVLVTGYDIIFFWVARMVFAGLEETGESPFEYVLVHGLVRDAQGRKMSKSLGNGVDPLDMIDRYGADALRFMLLSGITPGNDMRFQTERIESARNFANKLWNASRFVIMNLRKDEVFLPIATEEEAMPSLCPEDRWILSTVNDAVKDINGNMEKFEFALAAQKINELIWNEYCDWYIELVKSRLYGDDAADKAVARFVLVRVLRDLLKLLHPFMPFITEEIWSFLPRPDDAKDFLMLENWPAEEEMDYRKDVAVLELAKEVIRSVRNIRAQADAQPSRKLSVVALTSGEEKERMQAGLSYTLALANLSDLTFIDAKSQIPEETMSAALPNIQLFVPLDDLLDYQAEYDRLCKEKSRLEGEVERTKTKLRNEAFVTKAPARVIDAEQEKLADALDLLEKINGRIPVVEGKLG